jgi:hypothetical protein
MQLAINPKLNPGIKSELYACLIGNHPSLKPKKYNNNMAVKKYGNELINENVGGKIESNFSSLLHAIVIPIKVPIIKDIIREVPTNNNVHPSPDIIIDDTFSGK